MEIQHVLGAIADGSIASRQEFGFTVVDVAPDSATYQRQRRPDEPAPPTYVAVSRDTDEADTSRLLPIFPADYSDPTPLPVPVPEPVDETLEEDPEIPPLDEEEDDKPISNWRDVRSRVGRSRVPPHRQPPSAARAA
jgi:hypothetical protein